MGFFDNLWEIGDIVKDIVLLPANVAKHTVELGQDITETVAQDVQHKIQGTPHKQIRTSYTIRDEAEKLISDSQDEFFETSRKFTSQWDGMKETAERLSEARAGTYALIGQQLRSKRLDKLPSGSSLELYLPAI